MTTERIAAEQHNVNREHNRADADAKRSFPAHGIGKPERFPNIGGENRDKNQRHIKKVAMHVLHDQRKRAFAEISFSRLAYGAGRWISPERFVIRAAIVIAGQSKSTGRPKNQQRW